jgi:hypothetical protein
MASAAASSNYTASATAGAASSNYATTISFNDSKVPKFSEYRSRVCQLFPYLSEEKTKMQCLI